MENNAPFQQFLLENEHNPETDIILKMMLEDSASEDAMLTEEGFRTFAERSGIARNRKKRVWRRMGVGIATSLFLSLLLFSFWALHRASEARVEWVQVGTKYSESRSVSLPDGSTILLKPCSRLYYPDHFSGRERKVMLAGEAFLDVAKDPRKKFVVSAGDMDVTVHGTRFNVSSFLDKEEDEVALLEGSVEVRMQGQQGSVTLAPGELLKYDKQSGSVERRRFAANYYEEVLQAGGLQFNNEKLCDIAAVLTRNFGVKIIIEDPSLSAERYFASFINGEGVDAILSALNTGNHFQINRKNNIIYITR